METEREQRFAQLLQPIRELASTWSIDIATSLEDYLEELEQMTIMLEGGQSNLNFAEAALLIQGSTCIYSKKVEHLYALVLQTIEHLTNRNRARAINNSINDGQHLDDHDSRDDDSVGFLLLDDVIEEGKDIDLPLFGDENSKTNVQNRAKRQSDITRPTIFLVEEDYGSTFRMNKCHVDATGALIIEGTQLNTTVSSSNIEVPMVQFDETWTGFDRSSEGENNNVPLLDLHHYDGAEDDDNEDNGYDFTEEREALMEANEKGEVDPNVDSKEVLVNVNEVTPSKTRSQRQCRQEHLNSGPAKEEFDPWAPLDPHNPGTRSPNPLRRGRITKVPVDLKPRKKSTRAITDSEEEKNHIFQVPLAGLVYPEFRYIYMREKKRKAALTRAAERVMADQMYDRLDFFENPNEDELEIQENACAYDDFETANPFGDDDDPADDDDSDGNEGIENEWPSGGGFEIRSNVDECRFEGAPMCLDDAFKDAPQTYEDLCRGHIQAFMRGAEQYAHETGLSRRVRIWQDKLEPILREQTSKHAFDIRACGDAVLASAVSFLPRDIREELLESGRSNIKGIKIGVKRDSSPPRISFEKIVAGKERSDVCRMFLASLQLASTGSIVLSHGTTAKEQNKVQFEMQVLRAAAPQEVDGYFAPSLSNVTPGANSQHLVTA